jgi:hypothetical protein
VPAAIPETTPEENPTVALPVLLLLQVPVAGVELNVVNDPTHTAKVPEIDEGSAFTVTTIVVAHPDEVNAPVIVVVPANKPVTTPEALTVATAVLLLDHVTPPDELKVMEEPSHTEVGPVIAVGAALMVIPAVIIHPAGLV